jgi:hypothetical protein
VFTRTQDHVPLTGLDLGLHDNYMFSARELAG